jgi:hypothetical protein
MTAKPKIQKSAHSGEGPKIVAVGRGDATSRLDWFAKVASAIQGIATAIGIVVGGGWVLFTFRELGTTAKARSELAELDLKQRATEEELAQLQPNLAMDLKWEVVGSAGNDRLFISFHAKMQNGGKKPLEFKNASILLSRLLPESGELDPNAKPTRVAAKWLNADGSVSESERVLRSGQARTIAFLTSLIPGNYLAQLETVYRGMQLEGGRFVESSGEEIMAIDQRIVNVVKGSTEVATKPVETAQPR